MLIEKLKYFFCKKTPIGRDRIMASFFELFIFVAKEGYCIFYKIKAEKGFASVEIDVIVFCQSW